MKKVYFDNAATTAIRPEIVEEMAELMRDNFGNPSSTHAFGRKAKTKIEESRKSIAKALNVSASEIVFTSGGTEADNLIIQSCVRDLGVKRIISSSIEHHAVLHCIEQMRDYDNGVEVTTVQLTENGHLDYDHLASLIQQDPETPTLVSLMHINNEVGNRLDIQRVAQLCQEHDILFHSDCVQSVGHYALDLSEIPVDFIAASAHKFHGPKGVGFAYIRKGTGLRPLILGGQQERGYRAGTEGVHNIVGMAKALELSMQNLETEKQHILSLKRYMCNQLSDKFDEIRFNGDCRNEDNSTYTLLNVNVPCKKEKAMMFLFNLDLKGIACSAGSACQSGSQQGSHVLRAIYGEDQPEGSNLRFSFSVFNTKDEVDYTVQVLEEYLKES